MEPQRKYYRFCEDNGLNYSGRDVTDGDTVQEQSRIERMSQTERLMRAAGVMDWALKPDGRYPQ